MNIRHNVIHFLL